MCPIRSVGAKLFVYFCFGIMIPVIIVGLVSYRQSSAILQDEYGKATQKTIQQASEKLDAILSQYDSSSKELVQNIELRQAIFDMEDPDKEVAAAKLFGNKADSLLTARKELNSIAILSIKSGKVLSGWGNLAEVRDTYKNESWFSKIIVGDGKAVYLPTQKFGYLAKSDYVEKENSANLSGYKSLPPSFAVGRAILSNSGEVSEILLMEVKQDSLKSDISGVLGVGGQLYLVDQDQKPVFTTTNETAGVKLQHPFAIDKNSGLFELGDQLITYNHSTITKLTLIGSNPISQLTARTAPIRNLTFIFIAVAVVIAIGLGWVVVRQIGYPLIKLRKLMREGEQGNMGVRIAVRSRDEIGQLGESFNSMMSHITQLVEQTTRSSSEVLETAKQLNVVSQQISGSAREIATATEEIAVGASTQAMEAELVNDLTHNIGTQVKRVLGSNASMSEAAAEVQKVSDQGSGYLMDMLKKTEMTEVITQKIGNKVDGLKESAKSIQTVLDVLNSMTSQTNILSLNASIEAARAGAAGRGFSVIADEIRKLANESRTNIDVVGQIVSSIQNEMEQTAAAITEAQPVFREQAASTVIIERIFKSVQEQMHGFSSQLLEVTASVEQLEGTQRKLSDSMSNVSSVAEQSSAASQEVASVSNEVLRVTDGLVSLSETLGIVSNELQQTLAQFKI